MLIIAELKEKNRPSPYFHHLTMVADGVPALGWVVVTPTPAPYILEMKDAASFYGNKVIKEWKEKDAVHAIFVNSFSTFLGDLQKYVKQFHTTGLAWNAKGGNAADVKSTSAPVAAANQDAPKPAAPIVNPLGDLAKGTSGLRKVDKSEMTHKNPELRSTSVVKASDSKTSTPRPSAGGAPKGPPKVALEGNKWVVVLSC